MALLVPAAGSPGGEAGPTCAPMVVVWDGLLAHWDCNETNGSVLHDVSGNGHDGTVHGGQWVQGVSGRGLGLDGVDDRVQVPEQLVNRENLTFNIWIKSTDDIFGIISGANASQHNVYLLYVGDAGAGRLGVYYRGSSYQSQVIVSDGEWHMCTVATYENGTTFYLDGAFVESCDHGSGGPFHVEGLWMAADQDTVNGSFEQFQHLEGTIDEISIYGRVLTASEVNRTFMACIGEPPVWSRVPTVEAVEDVPVTVNVSSHVSDPDTPREGLFLSARSGYLVSSEGAEFTFLFPNGVLEATATFIASDGYGRAVTSVGFVVTPVNDPPELDPVAVIRAVEDEICTVHLRTVVRDVDNDVDDLFLVVDDPYVVAHGLNLTAVFPEGVTDHEVVVALSDGLDATEGTLRYSVTPVDDPPWVDPLGEVTVREDEATVFDLRPFIHDIDTPIEQLDVTTGEPNCTVAGLEARLCFRLGGFTTKVGFRVSDATTKDVWACLVVHVEEVNDPPRVGEVTSVLFVEDSPLSVDLAPFISDEDDDVDGLVVQCSHPCLTCTDGLELTFLFCRWVEEHQVEFTVSDGDATTAGTFLAQVMEVNDPPRITGVGGATSPVVVEMEAGTTLWLEVTVTDEDSPVFTCSARSSWKGVECFYNGTVLLTAKAADIGEHSVLLTVDDLNGGTDSAMLTVVVSSAFDTPFITSTPPERAYVGVEYAYKVEVAEPDAALMYLLDESPEGMTIESMTGDVLWTPGLDQMGRHGVIVRVTDGRDSELQAFSVTVTPVPGNRCPVFTTRPVVAAKVGTELVYAAAADDPEGDRVSFELLSGPPGMTVGLHTGGLVWFPGEAGEYDVSLRVHDGQGGIAYQNFTVTVQEATGDGGDGGGGFPWWVAGVVAAVAVAAFLLTVVRKRH